MMTRISVLALSAAMMLGPLPAQSDQIDPAQIEALVLETIRKNPEIIREAITMLQQQEAEEQRLAAEAALTDQRDLLVADPNAPVIGNPEGDVTIVEFFDYNCSYCRRVFADVVTLMEQDKNIRIVMREWPILGEESTFAARAALASREQGKYEEFHIALMENRGRATEAAVMSIAENLGINTDQLKIDMQSPEVSAHIQQSHKLTRALGLNGTPAFVFGDQLVPGLIELDQMIELVEAARS
jgi:protein-disulfide isomerase